MRRLLLAAVATAALTSPLAAQGVSFPSLDFPEAGTFCGPFQLCAPETTQDATR